MYKIIYALIKPNSVILYQTVPITIKINFILPYFGSGYTCPGKYCNYYFHYHVMNPFTSIISRNNKLQQWTKPVLRIRPEYLWESMTKDK